MADSSSFETKLAQHRAWIERHVGPWFGAVLVFGLLRTVLEWTARLHWVVGLATTLVLAAFLAALLLGWRKKAYVQYSSKHSRNDAGVLLLSTVLMAIAVFAAVSMLIYQFRPYSYTGASDISMTSFTDYYGWLTLDAIPGIRFSDTFHVSRPLEHHGLTPAICLLAFRLLVLNTLLSALKEWLRSPEPTVEHNLVQKL